MINLRLSLDELEMIYDALCLVADPDAAAVRTYLRLKMEELEFIGSTDTH